METTTRKTFLSRTAGGAFGAATIGGLARSERAQAAATSLDASYTSPYAPQPAFAYPSSWYVYTALIPGVINPFDVVVCNQKLGPLPDLDGMPDMRAVPSDATMLLIYHEQLPPGYDVSRAIPLNGNMNFTDLGGGFIDSAPGGFRRFCGWWAATVGGNVYGLQVFVLVGPSAGAEWAQVQPIVDGIHLPS
jgi:hypothetical protein